MSNNKSFVGDQGWRYWLKDHRARVYLLWMLIVTGGYLLLQFAPSDYHVLGWALASAFAFGYMLFVMPFSVPKMRMIFIGWFVAVFLGFVITIAAISVATLAGITPYLGVIWASVQALGFALNGIADPPSGWYWFGAIACLALGAALLIMPQLLGVQYLLLAVVSGLSMCNLWLFRSIYS